MGNSSTLLKDKYNREFKKEDIDNRNVFDYQELRAELFVSKGGSDQLEIIDKGIQITQNNNMSLKINGPSHVTLKDLDKNIQYDLRSTYQYPLKKYCVKVNQEKEYCTCDISVIDLVMDFRNMDIKKLESKL